MRRGKGVPAIRNRIGTVEEVADAYGVMLAVVAAFDSLAVPTATRIEILAAPVTKSRRNARRAGAAVVLRYPDGRVTPHLLSMHPELHAARVVDMPTSVAQTRRGQTFVHEVCHFAVECTGGDAGASHGRRWKHAMWSAGYPADVRHDLPLAQAFLKVVAHCERCGYEVRRARALRKTGVYRHTSCGGGLIIRRD